MDNKEIWPCRFAGDCLSCHPDWNFTSRNECYMTTCLGNRVHGDCDCTVLDDGTIAISYSVNNIPGYDDKTILRAIVDLVGRGRPIMFHTIHYICTGEHPGAPTSKWPLIWNGCVQIDNDKLTFEFVERRDTSD